MTTGHPPTPSVSRPSLRGHLAIARFDHWIKNVFVLPGVAIAISAEVPQDWKSFSVRLVLALVSVGLVASSNYTLNEVLDGPYDRFHPIKRNRPVPSGQVSIPWAYAQWLLLMAAGLLIGHLISFAFLITMVALWVMGLLYNTPPIRLKDRPYLDVLSESINNPLRMLAGWYVALSGLPPPASLIVSYWMIGCYFMTIKRYAEYREIADVQISAAYRKSFAYYNEQRLLVATMFYGSFAMLTFGAFIVRYRMELILAYPLVALVMAIYLDLSFKEGSAAQAPERLYREPALMLSVVCCVLVMGVLLFVHIPYLGQLFTVTKTTLPPAR